MSSNNTHASWQSVLQAGLARTNAPTASRAGAADEYPDLWPSPATLPVNGAVTGTVNGLDDVDVFRVSLTAGHAYRFEALGAGSGNGTLADPWLGLFGQTASVSTPTLAQNDDISASNLESRFTYTPTASGTYWVAMTSAIHAVGTYRVTLTDTSSPAVVDDYAASTATTGRLAVGGTASGTIGSNGDADWFALTLTAGQAYRLEVLGAGTTSGTLADPYLSLYNGSGTLLTANDDGGTNGNSLLSYTPTTSGTYYLGATSFGNTGTGSYQVRATVVDDYAASAATTGSVAVGGTASGAVNSNGDVDWFRITLNAGQAYRFEAVGAGTGNGTLADPVLYLYGSGGSLISSNDNGGSSGNALMNFTPTSGGIYYLGAAGVGTTTGTYQVRATAVVVDDFAASSATTGRVAVGGSASGVINSNGDNDWFALTLAAGQTYRLEMLGAGTGNGTLADPYLTLYNAAGSAIASNDDGGVSNNSLISYTATAAGTYYLGARAYGTGTGSYQVRASLADDYAANASTSGTLAVGGSRTGTVNSAGDADWFAIALTAGQGYRFEALGAGTGNGTLADPTLTLYSATGATLAFNDDGGGNRNSLINFTASASGTYYLGASGFATGTGSYLIRAATTGAVDDFAASTATTGTLAVGGSRTGTINTGSDADWFRITLSAGQTYRLEALGAGTGHGTLADPFLTLYNGAGTALASNDDGGSNGNALITYTATAAGIYYVGASGFAGTTGTYQVRASTVVVDDYAATTATTGTLAVGGSRTGTINSTGDADWFRITLAAGQTYRLEVLGAGTGNGTLADPSLTLYNGAGTAVASNNDGGNNYNALLTYTATAAGTYYLGASGVGSSVGSYLARVTSDDFTATTATSGRITLGTASAGNIESAGDQDWFAATLTAGTTYTVQLQGLPSSHGTLADPYFRGIYGATGTLIAGTGNDDYGSSAESRVVFTPTASGTYYLAAGGYGNGTGSYQLLVTGAAPADIAATTATTATVAVGGSVRSLISPASDVDWVRATLTAGQTYVIELNADTTAANPLSDPFFRGIYNAAGTLIAGTSNDDYGIGTNSRVTYTATTSGTYYLAAGGFGTTLGAYELRLSQGTAPVTDAQANSTATTAALAVGAAATASIDYARDEDWFRVTLAAGQSYRISARGADSGAGTLADPRLVGLFDAGGRIIAGTGVDNGDGTPDAQTLYTATTAGTYFVAVAAANDGTGTYAVQVQNVTATTDLASNVGTTGALAVGGTQSSVIDSAGDADWFRVSLTAGTTYQIDMLGAPTSNGSLADPLILGLFDASGAYVSNTRDDDSGTGNNARVTFTAASSGTYYLAAGAFGSVTGSYQVTLTAQGVDSTAPTLLGTAPADNAASVAPNSNLSLQFSEAVRAGTGNIVITGGGTTRTIAVTDASQVSFNGATLTINPSEDLAANTDYSVTLGAGVVRDLAGNAFGGIASASQFNFHTAAAGQQESWTVLVYMAADNNLESFGVDDLNEMESVTLPSNVNVTVLLDRAGGYDSSNGNWTDTRWGSVTRDSNTSTLSSSLTSLGERNTGDAATLTQFINNAVAANPASHYALIVWDHGGGLSGTSWDDASGGDNLSLAEYRAALQASSVSHFDIVGFDACLQGMLEQAWDVASLSDVLVASQELEPGDGWEYQDVLGTLASNPSATAFDLAASMVSSYGSRYAGQSDITMAATRTASLAAVKTALDNFANTAINTGASAISGLLSAASRATAIDGGSQSYRDLGDFMQEVASSMPNTPLSTAAQQVFAALDAAVLSQSGSVAGANGLSIYLPLSSIASSYNTDRYTFLQDSAWGNFLRFMLSDQANDTLTGNANANAFMGFGGNDVLRGDGGNDTLTGGAGADKFVFDSTLARAGVDTITDFTRGSDKIVLDDDIFTALGVTGSVAGVALSATAFNDGSSAVTAATRVVYNAASGALYYDGDGSGGAAAQQIALLGTTTHPSGLGATDFLVVA